MLAASYNQRSKRNKCMTRARKACLKLVSILLFLSISTPSLAVAWAEISSQECVYGDCVDGYGTQEIRTPYGQGLYSGDFADGEFHGYGRLELPVSFTEKAVYAGHWRQGERDGRGTFWNGKGNLYIGDWRNDLRHGQGSYFFNLPRWEENQHTEYWLKENFENYTGSFRNDFYHGEGTYRWPNGQKYVGGFFANDKHGFGTFYYETGTARKQLWEYGDFVR